MEGVPVLDEGSEAYEKISFRLVFLTVFRCFLDFLFNVVISGDKVTFGAGKLRYQYSVQIPTLYKNTTSQTNKLGTIKLNTPTQ
jgi:hypothetical protein